MHLIETLKKFYEVEINWNGSRYANYTQNKLQDLEFSSTKKRDSPYLASNLSHFNQSPVNINKEPCVTPERVKKTQKIIESFLYSAREIDNIIIKTLNSISAQQSTVTERTERLVQHFLEYLANHPDPKIRYFLQTWY